MDKCYMCGYDFTVVEDHGEHIIPNGIAGKLIKESILCKQCGEKLGNEVDVYFQKKFSLLLNLVNTKFDRNNKASGKCVVSHDGYDMDCIVKNGKLFIAGCYVNKANSTIYCNPNSIKDLRKKYGHAFTYISELDLDLVNLDRLLEVSISDRRALIKIATEFSLHCGVSIEHLDLAFDGIHRKYLDTSIIPYYPFNLFERAIEKTKWFFEKQRISTNKEIVVNSEYPTHSLHLFSIGRNIYCFISLFSFYEFYVHLSDSYNGKEISHWHFESVVKTTAYDSSYDLRTEDPKDIHICAQHWNISIEEVCKKIKEEKSKDPKNGGILIKSMFTTYKKEDAEAYMRNLASSVTQAISFKMNAAKIPRVNDHIPLEITSCLEEVLEQYDIGTLLDDSRYLYYEIYHNSYDEGSDDYVENSYEYFDLKRYKTLFLDQNGEKVIPVEILKNMDNLKPLRTDYQKNLLRAVVAASEMLYPTQDIY